MASRTTLLAFAITQYLLVSSSRAVHFVQLIYQPFGPKMCQELCKDEAGAFAFKKEDLSCQRLKVNDSGVKGDHPTVNTFTCNTVEMLDGSSALLASWIKQTECYAGSRHGCDQENCFDYPGNYEDNLQSQAVPGLKRGIELEGTSYNILLYQTCEMGNLCMAKYILSRGLADINFRGRKGRTPVLVAARHGHVELFKTLVNYDCDLSIADDVNNTVLHLACIGGHMVMVKYILLKDLQDIDCKGFEEWTPIMTAARYGHINLVVFFILKGSKLTAVSERGQNILHVACLGGSVDMVKYILNNVNINIDSKSLRGMTPAMIAAKNGHREVVEYLINRGSNLTASDWYGDNILHKVCFTGHVDLVDYILSKNILSIDCRSRSGWTPVMFATYAGHKDVVELLMNKGCNMTLVNFQSNVLHIACRSGNVKMVDYILSKYIFSIESRGWRKRTPVMIAALGGERNVFFFLVSKGCNLTVLDIFSYNILHFASIGGNYDILKYVYAKDIVGIDDRTGSGWTALMLTVSYGYDELFDFLVRMGSKVDALDDQGDNVLHKACMSDCINIVKYIIKNDLVGIESKGNKGRTPVLIAVKFGHRRVVDLLVRNACNLKAIDDKKFNILHMACIGGRVEMVEYILSMDVVNINSVAKDGYTPVMVAARKGHQSLVELLVNRGCDTSAEDIYKNNLLHMACENDDVDLVKYILSESGIGIDKRGAFGRTPFLVAAWRGNKDIAVFLVSQGSSPAAVDDGGNSALHLACWSGHFSLVKYLVNVVPENKRVSNKDGLTPLQVAEAKGNNDIVLFLERYRAL